MPTKIEWCDETWNPITGCTPIGDGCTHCYAMKMFDRNLWSYGREPTFHPKRFDKLRKYPDGSRVFVNSMGDLFHEEVENIWFSRVMLTIINSPRLTFIILTKRPDRMLEYFKGRGDPIPNLHLYVSVWDQASADEFIPILLDTPAAVRGVSIEPMLGPIDLDRIYCTYCGGAGGGLATNLGFYPCPTCDGNSMLGGDSLHSVILGGETGTGARPMHPDWARSVRDQCQAAGVPFFFKSMGDHYLKELKKTHGSISRDRWQEGKGMLDGRTWEELPE